MSVGSVISGLRAKAAEQGRAMKAEFDSRGPVWSIPTEQDAARRAKDLRMLEAIANSGLPGSHLAQQNIDRLRQEGVAAQNFFEFDPNAGAEFRTGQQALISALQQRASGNMPSAAELAALQQSDRGLAQAMALANSAQGVSPGLALRQAQRSMGEQNLQTMQTLAALRAQEQASAEAALANALQNARAQDIGVQQQVTGARLDQAGLSNDREKTYYNVQNAAADRRQQQKNMLLGGMLSAGGALLGAAIGGAPGAVVGKAAADQFPVGKISPGVYGV